MSKQDLIKQILKDSSHIQAPSSYEKLRDRVRSFIQVAYSNDEFKRFDSLLKDEKNRTTDAKIGLVLGYLEGLLAVEVDADESEIGDDKSHSSPIPKYDKLKVFIVHGHDTETKETVARFVQKVGLKPIILHEQPNAGLTIVEKLEAFSNVGFAVVLLTPDDFGGSVREPKKALARARQNVILELGYFMGKLSRNRVCALYKPGVEIPSDYGSVVYIELDDKGGWKTKLAQEFVHAGMAIEIEGLLET